MLEGAAAALLQGVAVIFPISGPGHAVVIGGVSGDTGADIAPETSGYLYATLRLAIGLALLIRFRREWAWLVRGIGNLAGRGPNEAARRWAGLLLVAVTPAAIAVAVLAPRVASLQAHPMAAAGCLAGNGALLLAVWWWFRRSPRSGGPSGTHRARLTARDETEAFVADSATIPIARMAFIGLVPLVALVPGLSAVGAALCAALICGLTPDHAARLALLVVTPLLLVWGAVTLPHLSAREYDGVRTALAIACVVAAAAAYLTASLLLRYFRTASLRPFGYYCVLAGAAGLAALALT